MLACRFRTWNGNGPGTGAAAWCWLNAVRSLSQDALVASRFAHIGAPSPAAGAGSAIGSADGGATAATGDSGGGGGVVSTVGCARLNRCPGPGSNGVTVIVFEPGLVSTSTYSKRASLLATDWSNYAAIRTRRTPAHIPECWDIRARQIWDGTDSSERSGHATPNPWKSAEQCVRQRSLDPVMLKQSRRHLADNPPS